MKKIVTGIGRKMACGGGADDAGQNSIFGRDRGVGNQILDALKEDEQARWFVDRSPVTNDATEPRKK
jgi:hypothetical protein